MKKKITLPLLIVLFAGTVFALIFYVVRNHGSFSFPDSQKVGYIGEEQLEEDFNQYEAAVAESGKPDREAAEAILDKMAAGSEISDPAHWIWKLLYPFTEDESTECAATELMQHYLDSAKGLTAEQQLQLESYQAILKNITGEYAESIMLFYDVLAKTKEQPESYSIIKTQSRCINYIAEMYYTYEDYGKAKELYDLVIEKKLDDPYEDAQLKYLTYLNLANISLEQKDYDQANKIVGETEAILPYCTEKAALETEVFLYNIRANIQLAQDDLTGAKENYEKCKEFLANNESTAFFDTEVYFRLTESEILARSGEFGEAEEILRALLEKGAIVEKKLACKVREQLVRVCQMSGQTEKYHTEQTLLLEEKNAQIKQYQSDYCEAVSYYEQLVSLREEHKVSMHQNEVLAVGLAVAVILLVLILRVSVGRYRDSITDALSGLYNRKQLEKEIASYEKNNHKFMSYGIIMADIDYFKRYNDTYGHAAGDEVIRRVSNVIRQSVRKQDIAIRYGGEEFLVLLRDINSSTVESIAERIRVNVQGEKIVHEASDCSEYVSLSMGGIHVEHTDSISLQDAIKKADEALYESKHNGRNRVTVKE